MVVSFDRIVAFILQRIGANFIQQADIAAFLTMIEQNAAPLFRNGVQRRFQLEAAVAAQAEQRVAGQTFGMYARQHRFAAANIAKYQRDMIVAGSQFFESHHEEIAPGRGQFSFCHPFKLHVTLQNRHRLRYHQSSASWSA